MCYCDPQSLKFICWNDAHHPKTPYLCLNVHLNVSAILMPPRVVTLTTSSIVLEFQAANGSVTHTQVEYAKEEAASALNFQSGSRVTVIGGESTYRVSQTKLIPGETYDIRVVPLVYIRSGSYGSYYRGIPSEPIKVMIPKPGRVCVLFPYLLLRISQ